MKNLVNLANQFLMVVPNPKPIMPPGIGEKLLEVLGWVKWGGLVGIVGGFIVVGVTMAYQNRGGEGADVAKRVMYVAFGAIIVGSASALAGFLTGA